ncbi:sugar kinase [Pseudoroseomonas wenyumeiae]|uniref:Sugar kinase n=1 Tax=Teichococcus wenyumeiae TaxID=2478470 RepID=A0A3A9JVY6_9PROT|nr:sugar kinase [Pseudoroseomonas wenyumeiae]RKK04978.1 sugar kinase [Pseudoroseomonas wenyumeiae]RMI26049.1 sugar kinase [Pseudoroseomonas wenyumeiae]
MSGVDLLCIGEPMLEFNQSAKDDQGRPLYLEGHGGDTSNAAIAAARAGAKSGYITAIGQDAPGQSFMDLWAREGVDTATVLRKPDAPTAVYFVKHGPQGHEFTFYRSNSAAARFTPEDVPAEAIRAAKVLHVSGISQAISTSACDACFRAIEVAKEAGVKVSYDTNLRRALWPLPRARAIMHAAIASADIALPSLDDATFLTGLEDPDAIADFYLKLSPLVLLKLGKDGSMVATREGRTRIPGRKVKAVDATGAGDTFAGNFLARILAGDSAEDAALYANAAAALATTGYGAVAPMPRPDAVRALLAEG